MSQIEKNPTVWEINGLELPLDLDDADELDKLSDAFNSMDEIEKEIQKCENPVRAYCDMFYAFYDRLFGTGTGKKIFDGKHNARVCDDVYENFLAFIQKQGKKNAERRMGIGNKYMPNRKQRRANNRRNNKKKHYYNNRYSGSHAQ